MISADILLHVRDIAHEDSKAQSDDVMGVLKSLFAKDASLNHLIDVHNKIDQWSADHNREPYLAPAGAMPLSAITGEGCAELLKLIDEKLSAELLTTHHYQIPHADGRAIAWLYANGQVMHHIEEESRADYEVRLSAANAARFSQQFGY